MLLILLISCAANVPGADGATPADTFILAPVLDFNGGSGVAILDAADGTELWRAPNLSEVGWLDAHLAPDASSLFVLGNDQIERDGEVSSIIELDVDGNVIAETPTPYGHHSFDLVPAEDGTLQLAWIRAFVDQTLPGPDPVVGDQVILQEPDGEPTVLLDCFDVLPFDPALVQRDLVPFYPGMTDWTHANALRWNENRQLYVLSLAQLGAVWEFDAAGTVTAVYTSLQDAQIHYERGKAWQQSPFPVYRTSFDRQHGAELGDDGRLRLLANGFDYNEPSYVAAFVVVEGRVQSAFEAYSPFEESHVGVLGGTSGLPDGGTVVSWGSLGGMQALDADGESLWVIDAPDGVTYPNLEVSTEVAAAFLAQSAG